MIKIYNSMLAKKVMFMLDKLENEFLASELNSIEELVINTLDYNKEVELFNFEELLYFNNLQKLFFLDMYVSNRDLYILKALSNLEELSFTKCDFEMMDAFKEFKLKHLGLVDCSNIDLKAIYAMKFLKSLTINNNKELNGGSLSNFGKLEYLDIAYCEVEGRINLPNLKTLIINNTNVTDLSFCEKMDNLETLSVDRNQLTNNQDLIEELKKKGVRILIETMDIQLDAVGDNHEGV